jgi:hypothetical protein
MRTWWATVGAAALVLSTTGCIKKTLLNGQIKGTREGSAAVDTLSDFEVAKNVAFAGLGQLEGMHKLAPDNEDALFMLTKGWSGAAFAFIEDEYEMADDAGNDAMADDHRSRARAAYDRAIHYGIELLEHKVQGFDAAKKNEDSIRAWLKNFDSPEDAANLLWVGQAWLGKVNVSKDVPEIVGELYVGVAMIERSVELDDKAFYGLGRTILGAYHARTAMSEMDEAYKQFQMALQINGGKSLMTKFQLAKAYYCNKGDKANYEKTLQEIIDAGDVLPEQRLQNTIAKRRARRYLSEKREENCGF